MRESVISDGVKSLSPDVQLTAKQIVDWIIEALDITTAANIPPFTIDSAGQVNEQGLWTYLLAEAENSNAKVNAALQLSHDRAEMHKVFNAVGSLFDVTADRNNIFVCWYQVSRFVDALRTKCAHPLFMLVSGWISATLLKKFVDVPDFHQNNAIMETMSICWNIGAALSTKIPNVKKSKIQKHLVAEYVKNLSEFYLLIGKHPIFLSAAFIEKTVIILGKAVMQLDSESLTKYLSAILFVLESKSPHAENMVAYCHGSEVKQFLCKVLDGRAATNTNHRQLSLKILKAVLEHPQKKNDPFKCDWDEVYAQTLYSTYAEIRQASMELFLLEVEITQGVTDQGHANEANEDNAEPSPKRRRLNVKDPYALLEKAIRAYHQYNDSANTEDASVPSFEHANIKDFIENFQEHEDLVTCKKLFDLLRKHVADKQVSVLVIIQIIGHCLDEFAKVPLYHNRRVHLLKEVLAHITHVEPYPHLLYRLINTIDLSAVKNDEMFREQIGSLKTIVVKAFLQCRVFGTAVELLEILKKLDYDDHFGLVTSIMEKTSGDHMAFLFWAADDALPILKAFNPSDRFGMLQTIRGNFAGTVDTEKKALYFAFMIAMLRAFNSTPHKLPSDTSAPIATEAYNVYVKSFLNIIDVSFQRNPLASIILGTTTFDYYVSFRNPIDPAPLQRALTTLAFLSYPYRVSFDTDSKQDQTKDLRLITKFWRNAIQLYKTRNLEKGAVFGAIPAEIFEFFYYAEDPLYPLVEEFVFAVLKFGCKSDRYKLFAKTVCSCIQLNKPAKAVQPLVKKLFYLIADKNMTDDAPTIATQIYLANLDLLCKKTDRPKTIWNVQVYLYQTHLQADNRKTVTDALNSKKVRLTASIRNDLDAFSKYLQDELAPKGSKRPKLLPNQGTEGSEDNAEEEDEDNAEPPPKRRRAGGRSSTGRRSNSLASINQSIV